MFALEALIRKLLPVDGLATGTLRHRVSERSKWDVAAIRCRG